jgi:hypothetical protein
MCRTTASVMMCDSCDFTDSSFQPDITRDQLLNDTEATLMSVKTYFQDAGWYTSLGYDLCPNCREQKGL